MASASNNAVMYIAAHRLRDRALLAGCFSVSLATKEKTDIENVVFDALHTQQHAALTPGARRTVPVTPVGGQLFIMVDKSAICAYIACVSVRPQPYSEAAAWRLCEEFEERLSGTQGEQLQSCLAESLTRPFRKTMRDLMAKYGNAGAVDKVAEVREKIEEVQGIMQQNVRRVLDAHGTLEGLDAKADAMNQHAGQYYRQSADLRRIMELRNLKLKLMMGGVVLALLLYIIIPLVG